MNDVPHFSLVIPCFNEARGLPELIRRCRFVAEEGHGEVILVDNGSADSSSEVMLAELGPAAPSPESALIGVRWLRVEVNEGYGYGITQGLAAASAPIVGWTHADLQTEPADALRALHGFESGSMTFVKGRRFGRPIADRFFTFGMSVFETMLLRAPLNDINAQPTMFSRTLLDRWGAPPKDFSLDLFAIYAAKRNGFSIRRFPVVFAPRRFGSSSWNTDWRAKRRFISRTIRFSMKLRRNL